MGLRSVQDNNSLIEMSSAIVRIPMMETSCRILHLRARPRMLEARKSHARRDRPTVDRDPCEHLAGFYFVLGATWASSGPSERERAERGEREREKRGKRGKRERREERREERERKKREGREKKEGEVREKREREKGEKKEKRERGSGRKERGERGERS